MWKIVKSLDPCAWTLELVVSVFAAHCASASVGRTAVRFFREGAEPLTPQARAVTHGHGHGPPFVRKQHGLYVVDVGDGEWAPVFLMTTVRPATALGGEEGLTGLPLRSRAQHLVALSGVGLHWGKRFTAEHGDTMDSPHMEMGTRE